MGKRVDYCARSVIGGDPNLNTEQARGARIGLSMYVYVYVYVYVYIYIYIYTHTLHKGPSESTASALLR